MSGLGRNTLAMNVTIGWVFRRALLYLGLAFAGLAFCGLLVFVSVVTGNSHEWFFPLFWTAAVLVLMLKLFRNDWHRPIFWCAIVGLLVLKLAILQSTVRSLSGLHNTVYMLLFVVEGTIWGMVIEGLLALRHGKRRRRHCRPRTASVE